MSEEERITDPNTGGQKGRKLERVGLIPAHALMGIARIFGKGAQKYEDRNWERGYAWSLSFDAMQRHAWQWWSGDETDGESGESHLLHAAWHCLVLWTFRKFNLGTDDRSDIGRGVTA